MPPRRLGAHTTRTSPQPTHQTVTALNKTQHKHQQLAALKQAAAWSQKTDSAGSNTNSATPSDARTTHKSWSGTLSNSNPPGKTECAAADLKSAAKQQQTPTMNKQNPTQQHTRLGTITETMNDPSFTPEQLPALWQQLEETFTGTELFGQSRLCWDAGIETMYRRCETYPQHAAIAAILAGLAPRAWHETGWTVAQGDDLAERATPEQLLETLTNEQNLSKRWWNASNHITASATVEQLTGPVIEQLPWNHRYLDNKTADKPGIMDYDFEAVRDRRRKHIVEHVQQQLLHGNKHAWETFLGIADNETIIGDTARLAHAIEQGNNQAKHTT